MYLEFIKPLHIDRFHFSDIKISALQKIGLQCNAFYFLTTKNVYFCYILIL